MGRDRLEELLRKGWPLSTEERCMLARELSRAGEAPGGFHGFGNICFRLTVSLVGKSDDTGEGYLIVYEGGAAPESFRAVDLSRVNDLRMLLDEFLQSLRRER